jgi:signal transduction histidine kinase/ligand-binding sensor domain-containing protein/CheY-like chemotaxis protein/AraC-like DNA-binding protein
MGITPLMVFKRFFRSNFIIYCAVLCYSEMAGFAQLPCIFNHYSTENGLSHSGVLCMLQDSRRLMWFGTLDGLNCFDGYTFKTFKSKPGDSSYLSNSRIDEMIEDRYGNIWVKTYDEKIHRFSRNAESFQTFPQNFSGIYNLHIKKYFETRSGDMWLISSRQGCFRIVNRNEPFPLTEYYSKNAQGKTHLPSNDVSVVFEDSERNIWIGTVNGLVCVETKIEQKISAELKRLGIGKINDAIEAYGKVWFVSDAGTFYAFDLRKQKFQKFSLPVLSDITSVKVYGSSQLLLATRGSGLAIWNVSTQTVELVDKTRYADMLDNTVHHVYVDKSGLVWMETESPGVAKFDPLQKTLKRFRQKIDPISPYVYLGHFFNVYEDVNGLLWVALRGGGFGYYNRATDKLEYFFNEPGSSSQKFSNLITCSLSDRHGNLWLSSYSRGIEKASFIRNKFQFCTVSADLNALSANDVRTIFADKFKNLWVGTRDGRLYCFSKDGKTKKYFSSETTADGSISLRGMVYSLIQDRSGALWIGTKGDGIIKAEFVGDPSQLKFKTTHFVHNPANNQSLSNNLVYSVFEDSKGRIWAGTFGGGINLAVKQGDSYIFKNSSSGFTSYPITDFAKVRHLAEDKYGQIWVATTNGLIVFDPNKGIMPDFRCYRKEPGNAESLAGNDVHYILRGKDNVMWLGSFGGGLNKTVVEPIGHNKPRFKVFNSQNDLPIDVILTIEEDKKGYLWLSTESGLSMFNPAAEVFMNFTQSDGLRKSQLSESASFRSASGKMYFGCSDGYYVFSPDSFTFPKEYPVVALTRFQLFNKDVFPGDHDSPLKQTINETQKIVLTSRQSVFSIEYAGLDFQNTEKLEYAFILEGFEPNWNYVHKQRKATYTNLPAGKYYFKVKCTSTGAYNEMAGKTLEIIVLPPWYLTWWAYIIYFVLAGLIAFISRGIILQILRLKNKVIIEQRITELKLGFFTNISHELRTPLTLILGPAEELTSDKQLTSRAHSQVQLIERNAHRMLRHVNQLLDFRKIEAGKMRLSASRIEVVSFCRNLCQEFEELAQSRNIHFSVSADIPFVYAWLDRAKMDMIVFNLLSNAFKFTPSGGNVAFDIQANTHEISLLVKDTGTGIAKEDIPLLFERFAISTRSKDFKVQGTGIGLPLVKELVTLHKGNIKVESVVGEGSTFCVTFKTGRDHLSDDEIIAESEKVSDVTTIKNMVEEEVLKVTRIENPNISNAPVILVVEDNDDMREYLSQSLKGLYNVHAVANGALGLAKTRDLMPDLIISDIMMPEMDGVEMTNRLRSEFQTSHIPIILLTAKSSIEFKLDDIKYGADAYIPKPFNMEALKSKVRQLLEQRRMFSERLSGSGLSVMELSPDEIIVTPKDEEFLRKVIGVIEDNLANPDFNVDMIADSVGLGRTTFFKKLKGLTGLAPVEFMREMRIKRSYQLLLTGNFNVSEVAYMSGFSDAGYFSKCFKEKYGQSPSILFRNKG